MLQTSSLWSVGRKYKSSGNKVLHLCPLKGWVTSIILNILWFCRPNLACIPNSSMLRCRFREIELLSLRLRINQTHKIQLTSSKIILSEMRLDPTTQTNGLNSHSMNIQLAFHSVLLTSYCHWVVEKCFFWIESLRSSECRFAKF